MSYVHRRSRLAGGQSIRSPFSENAIIWSYVFFGSVAGIGILVALFADAPGLRFLMAGLAAFMVLSVWFISTMQRSRTRSFLGFGADAPLAFRPPASFFVLQMAMAGIGMAAVLGGLVIDPDLGRGQGSFWIRAMAGGCAVWLAIQLASLRVPAGLRVTEDGLDGVRGVSRRRFAWDEVSSATPEVQGKDVALVITDTNGVANNVGASIYLGSDPAVVAAVVEHYLHHPEDRPLLSDPPAAIRHAEQSLAGQQTAGSNAQSEHGAAQLRGATGTAERPEVVADVAPSRGGEGSLAATSGPPETRRVARGWWWRWPLLVVVAFSWLATGLAVSVMLAGEDAWVGLVFYLTIAASGTAILLWHRRLRSRTLGSRAVDAAE